MTHYAQRLKDECTKLWSAGNKQMCGAMSLTGNLGLLYVVYSFRKALCICYSGAPKLSFFNPSIFACLQLWAHTQVSC